MNQARSRTRFVRAVAVLLLLNLGSGELSAQEVTLKGHSGAVMMATFAAEDGRVVTASSDQTAKLWDAATGKELLTFKGHRGWIFSVAFSPDGQRIVTACGDHTVKVWEAASKEQVARGQKQERPAAAVGRKPTNGQ